MKTAQKTLPKGWHLGKFGDLCDFELGLKANEGDGDYLEIGDIDTSSKKYDLSEKEKKTIRGAVKVPKGTLLISKVRPTRGAVVITDKEINVSPAFCRLKIPNKFFYYIANQEKFLTYLGTQARGSTYPTCKDEDILAYRISYPVNSTEQQRIAEILLTVDAEIEKTDQIVAATRKLKKGVLQQLFTRGIGHTKFKKTKLGAIPEKWEVKKFEDLILFKTGKLNSNAAVDDGEYPFFTCSQETFRTDSYAFDQEAILLAGNNAAGKYSVKHYIGKFNAYQRTYVITIKDKKILDYRYFDEVLKDKLEELRNRSFGSTTKFLTLKLLESLEMKVPPIEEQREIAEILSSIDEKILTNKKLKEKLTLLKKGLMQDLLSGKKRTV